MPLIPAVRASSGVAAPITWSAVTNADTCAEAPYFGGDATIEVTGTFNGATVQMNFGTVSGTVSAIDTNEKPAGAKFTSAGVCNVTLPPGFIQPTLSGGGGSQNLRIAITFIRT